MKIFILALMMICAFSGCGNNAVLENEEFFGGEHYAAAKEPELIWLKLPHYLEEDFNSSEGQEQISFETDISFPVPESFKKSDIALVPEDIPTELTDKIKENAPGFDFSEKGWSAFINYYTQDFSGGILKIIYSIGEKITTNKAAVCIIEDGVITKVTLVNMSLEADEEELLERMEIFENSTTQEKKIFEENEEFLSEDISYNYYYNIDTLTYCYQLFFYENTSVGQVINNDYGSEYIIDENGKPVK